MGGVDLSEGFVALGWCYEVEVVSWGVELSVFVAAEGYELVEDLNPG